MSARTLEDELRAAIQHGRLRSGIRLPASRTLASDLGLARNTVALAYGQLVAEGWLVSRVGAGTWVSGVQRAEREPSPVPSSEERRADLRGGIPDTTLFPRKEWSDAARKVTLHVPDDSLGYPDPRGVQELRQELADYLSRARGVRAAEDCVFIAHGFGDVLAILARVIVSRGVKRIGVERFGHARHSLIVAASGLEIVPVPVDSDGMDVAQLDSLDVGAVIVTPAHQFPTGVPLSADRRRALVGWAERTGSFVIEDDYDGEFRYDRRSIGALQSLAPDRVIYAGTASKVLAPAIGLAWAVLPASLLPAALEQRARLGSFPAALDQLTIAEFIREYAYDRHVRRLRLEYRRRRELLESLVAQRLPEVRVSGVAAGLHCVLELPPGSCESDIEAAAARRGLHLEGLQSFLIGAPQAGAITPSVVIGYGAPRPHLVDSTLHTAIDVISEHIRHTAVPHR